MANLSIRDLDKTAYEQLRLRAANHGVSMEEEVRQIIYHAISTPDKISLIFQNNFGKKNGINLRLPPRKAHQPFDITK